MKNNIKGNIIEAIGFSTIFVIIETLLNIGKFDITYLFKSFALHAFCYFIVISFHRWICNK